MNRSVDLGEADPRSYVRLAARIRKQIISGDLVSGRPVPSITTLSQALGHVRSYVIQGMRMLAVTWANDKRGKSVFWLHTAVRRGIWPSVDDQLGITPRASHQILLPAFSRPNTAFQQLMSPFQAARRRNLGPAVPDGRRGQVPRCPPPAHLHRHAAERQQQEAGLPRPRVVPGPRDLRGEADQPPGAAASGDERGTGEVEEPDSTLPSARVIAASRSGPGPYLDAKQPTAG